MKIACLFVGHSWKRLGPPLLEGQFYMTPAQAKRWGVPMAGVLATFNLQDSWVYVEGDKVAWSTAKAIRADEITWYVCQRCGKASHEDT